MSVSVPSRTLEEHRQALILGAQDQIKRLQAIDLTKRELADAAMEISERSVMIHQLREWIFWLNRL